jgi:hypothetical protein
MGRTLLAFLFAMAAGAMGGDLARSGLVRHPVDGPRGNAFGFDEGGAEGTPGRIAHVSVAPGRITRVRFVAAANLDASAIRFDPSRSFHASRDVSDCGPKTCVIRIEGRLPKGPNSEHKPGGEVLRVRGATGAEILDSMVVHVYPERVLEARVVRMGTSDNSRPLDASQVRERANASLRFLVAKVEMDSIVEVDLPDAVARLGFVAVLRNGIGRSKYVSAMVQACAREGGLLCLQEVPYRWAWILDGSLAQGFTRIDTTERDFARLYPRIGGVGRVVGESDGASYPVTLRFDRQSRMAVLLEDSTHIARPHQRWILVFDSGDNPAALHHNFLEPGTGHRSFIGVATPSLPRNLSQAVGDVLAHELGHSLGLGDVDDPTNRMHYNIRWADHLPVPFAFRPLVGVRTGTSDPDTSRGPWCQWEERR